MAHAGTSMICFQHDHTDNKMIVAQMPKTVRKYWFDSIVNNWIKNQQKIPRQTVFFGTTSSI